MDDVLRPSAEIIAFDWTSARMARTSLREHEPRGEILLFTGVRYERLEPGRGPSGPLVSDGQPRRRRRRL
jgi:hypothetical protein